MEDDEEYSDDTVDINDENESLENGADLLSAGSSEIRTSNSAEGPENLSYDNDDYYYYEDETDEDYFRRKQRELRAERLRRMQERRRAWLQKQRKEYYRSLSRWRHPQVEGKNPKSHCFFPLNRLIAFMMDICLVMASSLFSNIGIL